jgi:hypothetical protein
MHPELAEYLQCIDPDDLGNLEAVEASWLEAQRIMSPQGLENYLVGIKSMCTLGKGQDLVEDIVPDTIEAIMKLSSLTSGAVITLILANLPLAATRLGDAELLRGYLKLLHLLAGKAPRGLRPMRLRGAECLFWPANRDLEIGTAAGASWHAVCR